MTNSIDVLDKGFVKYITHSGDDLLVVNAARVSFNTRKDKFGDSDAKLLKYLARHSHWTPFAHPSITLHVKAPIYVRTQLYKHKVGLTENEISRRYVSSEPDYYIPKTWRSAPGKDKKQGSGDPLSKDLADSCELLMYEQCIKSNKTYSTLLSLGVAPEQARGVLPQCTYTEWFWTGSLSAFSRIYNLRSSEGAQAEVREYAEAISTIISPLMPISWKVLTVGETS